MQRIFQALNEAESLLTTGHLVCSKISWMGSSLHLESNCRAAAKDIFSYVTPYFHVENEHVDKSNYAIRFVNEARVPGFKSIVQTVENSGEEHKWFFGKTVPIIRAGDEFLVSLRDDLLVLVQKSAISMFSESRSEAATKWAKRFIREYLVSRLVDGLRVHGGVAPIFDSGAVIIGANGAGKTSLMLHLLHELGGNFCCNDRAVLVETDGGVSGLGTPIQSQISAGSLAMFPGHPLALDMLESTQRGGIVKYSLSPREMTALIGADITRQVTIGMVIVPNLSAATSIPPEIRPIPLEFRTGILLGASLQKDPAFPAAALGFSEKQVPKRLVERVIALPWYSIAGHYADRTLAKSLVDAVGAHRTEG
ncbi:hypothetical protein [Bradyrhizobium sp. BR 10261]|uniref:hypothetical protein n=1 Tax=Bradyrhizobium sp. BR 10261 TaxID=2749992 RepID=UPI001C64EA9D|nr:hypothetical protein [Bradyrhizobium sp. BR 10261]MBW7962517.1 hypothetical protein [Bradyrhizobium sp. BR 10261]